MQKKWLTGALVAFFISGMIPMTLWADTTDSDELTVTDVTLIDDGETVSENEEETEAAGGYLRTTDDMDVPSLSEEDGSEALLRDAEVPSVYNPKASRFTGGYTLPAVRNQNPYGTCWAAIRPQKICRSFSLRTLPITAAQTRLAAQKGILCPVFRMRIRTI